MEVCNALPGRFFLFLCASVSGVLFALVWRKYEQTIRTSMIHPKNFISFRDTNYEEWLQIRHLGIKSLPEEDVRYLQMKGRKLEEAYLFSEVRILCLVFVSSPVSAEAVKNTWASHCNSLHLFGRFVDDKLPVIKLPHLSSFESFCYAFVHVWKKHKGRFEWAVIVDDTTYVVVENLRLFVAPLNSSISYYLGHVVKDFSNLYNLGSAGIVLSKSALLLLSTIYKNMQDCRSVTAPSWYFDQALGRILSTYNVHPVDTRDKSLRARFNPFPVEKMIIPGSISVFSSYWRTSVYLADEGGGSCSDRAVTFHGNKPSQMYFLEYMLYHLSTFRHSLKGLGNKPHHLEN